MIMGMKRSFLYMLRFGLKKFPMLVLGGICLMLAQDGLSAQEQQPALPVETEGRWAHERSDIPADPRVFFGELENGFRYILMPNAEPPQRISIKLWVNVGSLHEEDHEQGLAHFLEHAAFLGTHDFDAREQKEYFQRLGMRFGADTNAHTGFAETAYKLELPDNNESLLKDAFRLLRGYADGMSIPEEEIVRERGVILSEKRDRDGAGYRTLIRRFKFLFEGTRLTTRFPIGEEEVIAGATSDLLRSLYQKWYIPQRMVLVAVGDLEVAELEALIQDHFADMKNPEVLPEDPEPGLLNPEASRFDLHRETEYEVAQIGLYQVFDYKYDPDTIEGRYTDLVIELANDMLTHRFTRRAMQPEARFSGGYGMYDEGYRTFILFGVGVSGQPRYWKEGLEVAVEELRRAVEYGFLPVEFEEAKARYLRGLQAAMEALPTVRSDALSNALMRSVADDFVFSHPEFDLELGRSFLESLPLEQVNQIFSEIWGGSLPRVFLTGNLPEEVDMAAIEQEFSNAWHKEVEAPEDLERPEFAYTEFREPGTVVNKQHEPDLDIHLWELSNGVRVNLKTTDFENDRIHLMLRVDGGLLSLPEGKPGLPMFAELAMVDAGLGKHSIDEIQRIFAGKLVGVRFSVESDAFILTATTTPEELEVQLKLLTAYLTDPGFRNEGLRVVNERLPMIYSRYLQTPEGNWNYRGDSLLFKSNYRLKVPSLEEVEAVGMNDLREWLLPAFQNGYVELSMVGEIDREQTEQGLLATLGSLPDRAATPEKREEARKIEFREQRGLIRNEFSSAFPRALAVVAWPAVDYWEVAAKRKLRLLSEIFTDRLNKRLRGEMGDVYTPYSFVRDDEAFTDYGYFVGTSLAASGSVERLAETIRDTAADLAGGDLDEDSLQRARQPLLKYIRDSGRNNAYWLERVLSRAQSRPEVLDHARDLYSSYEGFTLEDIKEVAARFLKPEKAYLLVFSPSPEASEPVSSVDGEESSPTAEQGAPQEAVAE